MTNEDYNNSSQSFESHSESSKESTVFNAPKIELPKGGGAIQGIGEKFQVNPSTGTGSFTVPIAMSPGRSGFTPQLSLSYDSGAGNSPFGAGWNIGLPFIRRKTSRGLPKYNGLPTYYDNHDGDVFLLSGAEDLIPKINGDGTLYQRSEGDYTVYRYIPRIEGLFARIEKWVNPTDQSIYWKSITKENITTIYGRSENAKITDPKNPWKVFEWKIEQSYDDKGNIIIYEYKKEDGVGLSPKPIFEKNRNTRNAYSQTYLKKVCYGNSVPFLKRLTSFDESAWQFNNKWLFELILDYGEHYLDGDDAPSYLEKYSWSIRKDIFSSFRSGFDIRTYRLCRRILMYHHFESELSIPNYLVKATHLIHNEGSILSQISSITHSGYRYNNSTGKYINKSYPPITLKYTEQKIDEKIYEINASDLANVPQGIDNQNYQFIDLYGEGLNGILSQKKGSWYYKRNEGNGKFGEHKIVSHIPSLAINSNARISDLDGNGLSDVLVQNGSIKGYYELSEDDQWSIFKSFDKPVNFDLDDPNLRMLDIDGNGIPDILISENDCFVWYPADEKKGYKVSKRVSKVLEEEKGPRIIFSEIKQTIFLSDMTGDGLTDIVRIRNGEICYWANMGYGKFSEKILMANSPFFDSPDQFDPSSLRLADIDGSGTTDIIYLGREHINYHLNQSGNSWSDPIVIKNFPKTSKLHTVSVMDLLGNGTSCIVWSSPLPTQSNSPMKYIQLMGQSESEGNKPYLIKEVNNNMGAITRLKYEASTKFYLEDRKQGRPWITKLPFPVQVMVRQEVYDEIAGNHFVSRYAYHHGYFDREEREFRGFGMVEQWDTEDYDTFSQNTLFQAPGQNWTEDVDLMSPVYTKTWFHNGYFKQGDNISQHFKSEYYDLDTNAWHLADTVLPVDLTAEEMREAARALKGRVLRSEVYGEDGSSDARHPYTVVENKFHIDLIQQKASTRHASFYVCECESLSYHYERNPDDPRIAHQSILEIDKYGNKLKTASIVYPRRTVSPYPEQNHIFVTINEADFINKDNEIDYYRIGVPYAQRTYQLSGLNPQFPFEKLYLKNAINNAIEIPFESSASSGLEKRLIKSIKSSFYSEDLSTELSDGEIAFHALPFKSYEAVFTQGLIDKYVKDGSILISSPEIENKGGFIQDGDYWWRPSGYSVFDPDHFYLPTQLIDPFGQIYHMEYDGSYIMMNKTKTSINGIVIESSSEINYRILNPNRVTNPNGNSNEVIYDELGLVIATAVSGKNGEGDHLDNYQRPVDIRSNLAQDLRQYIYDNQSEFLQTATSFHYYDLEAWSREKTPNYGISIVRETHLSDEGGTPSKTQINFYYSDGFGQTIMTKVQAEAGDAYHVPTGNYTNANPRWAGNGRTVFNNKGKPVKQYEPFFSHDFDYETELELIQFGVSPILHYDTLGRNIRTDFPDGSFTKVEFNPWQQISFDQNDNIIDSEWKVTHDSSTDQFERRAASVSLDHNNTPKVEHLDTLGRIFLMQDDNASDGVYDTRFEMDILGNQTKVTDAKGRLITVNHFNMLGEPILTESMDAGRRWKLSNIIGNPVLMWNERNIKSEIRYDSLNRNIGTYISESGGPLKQVYKLVYGEEHPDHFNNNMIGLLWKLYDQSGLQEYPAYDFKGIPESALKQIAEDYKNILDWSSTSQPVLEEETFNTTTEQDALGRIIKSTAPDGSETIYSYNEANFIEGIAYVEPRGGLIPVVNNIDYNAKGQRTRIQYANGVTTKYNYDSNTFRLTRLESLRGSRVLQDLNYYYDPVGNITDIQDFAQDSVYYRNRLIQPHTSFEYDALYRLKKANGREHIGQSAQAIGQSNLDFSHYFSIPNVNDNQAMQVYQRQYSYDELGNIKSVNHNSGSGGWTRNYFYEGNSQFINGDMSNQLSATELGGTRVNYTHDLQGNIISMPHLQGLNWDFADQLKGVQIDLAGNYEHYCYTIGGGKDYGVRMRKVLEYNGVKVKDRIYIGQYEVYREYAGGNIKLERSTSHLEDGQNRIGLVDKLSIENRIPKNQIDFRYQLSNHLGSSSMELDQNGAVISYEEYYPFGSSSFRAGRSASEVQLKRYRYIGKERDENTGLYYYGARYYAAWKCRFISVDALKNIYPYYTPFQYAGNKPISFIDLDGLEEGKKVEYNIQWNVDVGDVNNSKRIETSLYFISKTRTYGNNESSSSSNNDNSNESVITNQDVENMMRQLINVYDAYVEDVKLPNEISHTKSKLTPSKMGSPTKLISDHGKIYDSPGVTKSGRPKQIGGAYKKNGVPTKFTTSSTNATDEILKMNKKISVYKAINEAATVLDLVLTFNDAISSIKDKPSSGLSDVDPFVFAPYGLSIILGYQNQKYDELNLQFLETDIQQGYDYVKRFIENFKSKGNQFAELKLIDISQELYDKIERGEITTIQELEAFANDDKSTTSIGLLIEIDSGQNTFNSIGYWRLNK